MHNWKRFNVSAWAEDGQEEASPDGRYVLAEEAIAREAELLARIQFLEGRAAEAVDLISKAVGLMPPAEGSSR